MGVLPHARLARAQDVAWTPPEQDSSRFILDEAPRHSQDRIDGLEIPVADFTDVRKVRFGASARTSEGERGSIAEVLVDQATGAALAVGIRFGAFGKTVYTSLDHVISGDEHEITLDTPRSDLVAAAPAGTRLNATTQVSLDGKRIGRLAHITFDYSTRLPLRIVIERGMGGSVATPASAVAAVNEKALVLTSGRNGSMAPLTPYHPDSELRASVRRAIERYGRMRVDIGGVDIQAVDGAVWLRGNVSSELNRRLVEDLSSGVAGVAELHNELVTDPALAASISSALARDPVTAEERIGVYPALGRVSLRGMVRTPEARDAAARIARTTHAGYGAREVINELRVDPRASVLPALASVTGEEDAVPGGR
jgi:osmotically-inducible protein OsmY